jgi:hypothetical protein
MSSRSAILIYLLAAGILLWAAWPMALAARVALDSRSMIAQVILLLAVLLVGIAVALWPEVRVLKIVFYVLGGLVLLGAVGSWAGIGL